MLGGAAPASRIENCVVERNTNAGVMVAALRGCSVLRNRVSDNGVGIVVTDGATPRLEGNDLSRNGTGIGVRGEGTNPHVIGNSVVGTGLSAIVIDESACGHFEGNSVCGAGDAGIWVDDPGTAPTISANHVSHNGAAGVLVTDGGGGRFRDNDLRANGGGSWELHEAGELERFGNLEDTGRLPLGAPNPAGRSSGRMNDSYGVPRPEAKPRTGGREIGARLLSLRRKPGDRPVRASMTSNE